jgi:hypothetical protein
VYSHGIDDVHGVAELEALGNAIIEAHELGHDLGDWRLVDDRMRLANCRRCRGLVWIVRRAKGHGVLAVVPRTATARSEATRKGAGGLNY